ncbi:MAG: hypothetical protein Q4G46_11560, partial [Propionibacteriaceae bacterium]|nr:hypothetical protein [Propionibacteriaceae bacterium]
MRDTLSLGKALAAIGFFLVAGIGSWWMAASEGFLMYAVAVVCFGFVAFGSGALLLDAWRRIRGPRRDPFPAGHAPDLSADPSGSGFARGGAESPFTTDPFDPTGVPPGADASSFPHKPLRGMPMRVARATLEALVEAGVLAPLTDSETERVLAGLPDAEMETILATVQELLGERPGDAFPLWDQVEQNEEYVTDLVDGFARLSGMPIRVQELVIDPPPDGVRRTRLRLVLQFGV